ncbi:MAG: chemotaxis response regulator protein-glutamate methylesterase [Desulfosarcinaceae bacterium]
MQAGDPIKVLVVDDTIVYRKIVSDVLSELPGVEVVGTAHNGKSALMKIKTHKPDLITLDIEMPEMNGLETLEILQREAPQVGAIMLSTLTHQGGIMTMRALELGAFDFIPKPQDGTMAANTLAVKNAIGPMIKAFSRSRAIRGLLHKKSAALSAPAMTGKPVRPASELSLAKISAKASIIGIGVSTGGPNALAQMLPMLPGDIGVPIVIVQHMPPVFTQSLAKSLDGKCALSVREGMDGDPVKPNTVYIAPGGKQMKIVAGGDGRQRVIKVTNDPPENSCKPSVDYLFRSLAEHYVGRATGVIMTGMGSDGTAGLRLMKNAGATVIAQDESSCVVFGMPKEPIESGVADIVAPLDRLADAIMKTVSNGAPLAHMSAKAAERHKS